MTDMGYIYNFVFSTLQSPERITSLPYNEPVISEGAGPPQALRNSARLRSQSDMVATLCTMLVISCCKPERCISLRVTSSWLKSLAHALWASQWGSLDNWTIFRKSDLDLCRHAPLRSSHGNTLSRLSLSDPWCSSTESAMLHSHVSTVAHNGQTLAFHVFSETSMRRGVLSWLQPAATPLNVSKSTHWTF